MTIALAKSEIPRAVGEWAPAAPAHIRAALSDRALRVWLEVHARPDGWTFAARDVQAELFGMSTYGYRRALTELRRLGLYLVERIRDAGGRWSTQTTFLTSSPQVTPKAGFPAVGTSAGIPPITRMKRGAGEHTPATCRREAAGKSCRQCGKARRAAELQAVKADAAARRQASLMVLAERANPTPAPAECEHGTIPTRCAYCRRAASPPTPAVH